MRALIFFVFALVALPARSVPLTIFMRESLLSRAVFERLRQEYGQDYVNQLTAPPLQASHLGHVALSWYDSSAGRVVFGWRPRSPDLFPFNHQNSKMSTDSILQELTNYNRDKEYNGVEGHVANDRAWLLDGFNDARLITRKMTLSVTQEQLELLKAFIFQSAVSRRYRLLPQFENGAITWPENSFNCVIFVKRALQAAGLDSSFLPGNGSIETMHKLTAERTTQVNFCEALN